MEEPIKEQPSGGVSAGNSGSLRPKLQRYALRSSIKSKEQKQPDALDRSNSSESNTKRGRITPNVSKSVGVLDFSGKEKSSSAKPPRRQSIPAKSVSTPGPKVVGSVTPISETRTKTQSRSQTPSSDISKTSSRIKFNLLTSASYWLNQIKLSENAAKHSLSFGFFKLALEAGCEPFQRIQDELKSYVQRNQLADLGAEVKELFGSYNIAENLEQLQLQSQSQVSESVPDGPRSSDDEVMATRKLKPKCLDTDSAHLTPVTATESTKKETNQKGTSGSRLRESLRMYSANSKSANIGNRRSVQKSEKQSKNQGKIEKGDVKKDGKKSDAEEVPSATEDNILGNKENMDVGANEGVSLTEEVV
ncbi:uncharacterized protein LOC130951140 isoform X1 [Arachis stenosperma]|uniref:uncharacterized protein LOC130951140 isoform X1 n=1 Tax=Arachis stenosperma TaxID=217475 RepID=UPI0025AB9941|nr:uncharacterized protein LOC130951140 isoform X1 [Arachis stenosperma]